jgi:hypothetical protein
LYGGEVCKTIRTGDSAFCAAVEVEYERKERNTHWLIKRIENECKVVLDFNYEPVSVLSSLRLFRIKVQVLVTPNIEKNSD